MKNKDEYEFEPKQKSSISTLKLRGSFTAIIITVVDDGFSKVKSQTLYSSYKAIANFN